MANKRKTVGEVVNALHRIPNQNLPVHKAVALMAENPTLPVIAVVDGDIMEGESQGWWYASIKDAYVDEVCSVITCCGDVATFAKSTDDECNIFEAIWDYDECGIDTDRMSEEEVDRLVHEKICNELEWTKCICLEVSRQEGAPFIW